ncbi:hypothetical protein ACRYCC_32865 [Actinomadura scrupuli]|uniref:hypothetical protein n=1 Tax=Actinomadura scrupuli TaxID=559629 RepID=UPI003D9608FE
MPETTTPPALSDAYPVLLGPVRMETRFTATELLVRVFPDEWAVDTFEEQRTTQEQEYARTFWSRTWQAGGDRELRLAAWHDLAGRVGSGRAGHIVDSRKPLNPADEPHRTHPEQVILVVAGSTPIATADRPAGRTYWAAVYRADGDATALRAADTALNKAIGNTRADKVRAQPPDGLDRPPSAGDRQHADVTVAFLDLPAPKAADTRATTWTKAARARLLPDAFTLLGYVGGQLVVNVTGKPVKPDLAVGPDPSTPAADQFTTTGGTLHIPSALAWLTDFDQAVAVGMGFRIPLTDAIKGGLDRLIVLGLRARTPEVSRQDLETLITHQAGSRTGFEVLPQGTPTNNTGTVPSAFGTTDLTGASFAARFDSPGGGARVDPLGSSRSDGQWLAELLGIDPAVIATVPGSDGTDQSEARAMNAALWPATWGHHLGTTLNPIFGTAALDATRSFFTRYVSGRGPVPAVRIGRQPYGILVTTAFSRLAWTDTDPDAAHRRKLNSVLTAAAQDWTALAANVPVLGDDGDPHALLLGLFGLHPASAEFYQRYGQSAEDYFNRLNLGGEGQIVLDALNILGLRGPTRDLLTRLGYPATAPDPDVVSRLFVARQHAMRGPLVDDRPLSESAPVRPYTTDGRNYLDWLATTARNAFDAVRLESGFAPGATPAALLYLLLRHAVLIGYHEAALRLSAAAHGLTDAQVTAARRDPPFIHISQRTQVTESRYGLLYGPDQAVTGDPDTLLADFIPAALAQQPPPPGVQALAEQLAGLSALAQVPTARLERVLAEHLDCAAYRLDAWRLGLATERLFAMRYPASGTPVKGVHLGAFGWLEDLKPRTAQFTQVTLTGDLATTFTPPGAPPLLHDPANQGFLHAPSPSHAATTALLRSGYLADASPASPGTLSVDLTSDRVRVALSALAGIRGGQSLGALLGYRLERGLHDGHDIAETDAFILALRQAFPLVAGRLPETVATDGTDIASVEARNVVDGLALVREVTRGGTATYPWGRSDLPQADPDQAAAIDAEVAALVDVHDALAELVMAESVHQTVLGNPDRAAATLDAFVATGNPPDPEVVRTPRTGRRLTHRFALHLKHGRSPNGLTPRGSADPAVDDWLEDLLPDDGQVACVVTWTDPDNGAARSTVVTQHDLDLRPIDLLWTVRPDDPATMTELDDRIIGRVQHTQNLRGDVEPVIRYTDRIPGKISFFELSSLVSELRALLLAARPGRPSDATVAASGATLDPAADDAVDLPRARPAAVRSALASFAKDLDDFLHDLGALLANPVAHRGQLLSGIDALLTRYADLLLTGDGLGLVRSGWGELMMWRKARFDDVQAAVQLAVTRMTASLAAANAKLAAHDALPNTATAEQRYALLQAAERLLTTAPTSPRPDTPQKLRGIVITARNKFTNRLNALSGAIGDDAGPTLAELMSDVSGLLPISQFDATGLTLAPIQDTVIAFCADLLARATDLRAEVADRLTASAAALADYDHAADGPGRVAAATAAIRAVLGPDALATSEFTLLKSVATDWQNSFKADLTQGLARDFPLDDWLHGLARVRPVAGRWERITLLAGAIGRDDPDLRPVQLPFVKNEPWLGLELPAGQTIEDDRLLYTAHYAEPFDADDPQCSLLLDEWTETVPGPTATTGVAAQYDRPGSEPPQSMLLVTPANRTGTWKFDDLVAAVGETLDLARTRAVEPGQLDATAYAQLLPATVLPVTPAPITISTDLAANNAATLGA